MSEWILIITLALSSDGGTVVKDIPGFPTRDSCGRAAAFWNQQWFERRHEVYLGDYVRSSGFAVCVERPVQAPYKVER